MTLSHICPKELAVAVHGHLTTAASEPRPSSTAAKRAGSVTEVGGVSLTSRTLIPALAITSTLESGLLPSSSHRLRR